MAIERIGRSGVELHEVRKNVNVDGDDTGNRAKPNNIYMEGKKSLRGGWNCGRARSCGFGPGKVKPLIDESLPVMTREEKLVLRMIAQAKDGLSKGNTVCAKLVKMDMVIWSDKRGAWALLVEGRRVIGLIGEK